jgi:hypothetical protein
LTVGDDMAGLGALDCGIEERFEIGEGLALEALKIMHF